MEPSAVIATGSTISHAHIRFKLFHKELFYASYNIEITRGYGVKNLYRFLNLTVTDFYLAIYIENRRTNIGYKWASV